MPRDCKVAYISCERPGKVSHLQIAMTYCKNNQVGQTSSEKQSVPNTALDKSSI